MHLSETAKRAIEAYGGWELWQNAKFVEAVVSARGLAFTLKQRPYFRKAHIIMETGRPYSRLTPIGKRKGISGLLDGHDVRLVNEKNEVLAERKDARGYFPFGRRLYKWDDLDQSYFANYAFWNYLTLPRLLMNENIFWHEKEEGVLLAKFPRSIPTHSEIQEFHFNAITGRLIQHNYTAEIISSYAKAANVVLEHAENDTAPFTSLRRVTPQSINGMPLKVPLLIEIKVHSLKVIGRSIE